MDQLIELLQQIQDLAGVAVDALKGAGGKDGEHKPGEGGPPHEGGHPPEGGGKPPMHEGGDKPPEGGPPHEGGGPPPEGGEAKGKPRY